MPLNLAYFHSGEAEQYGFYRIPKTLFTDSRYEGVSIEAKLLYGLMLDRMGLSVRNGWMDEQQRVYIYFTLEDSMAMMGCGHNKAIKLFATLEQIGLVERSNQMLKLLNSAVELLRTRHKNGEAYYWLLYYTYLSPQQPDNAEEVIEQLQPYIRDISISTYYRKRKKAVETLSSVLWGYTSQESEKILSEFFPPADNGD